MKSVQEKENRGKVKNIYIEAVSQNDAARKGESTGTKCYGSTLVRNDVRSVYFCTQDIVVVHKK